MTATTARSTRLQTAALAPIGGEARTERVESRLMSSIVAGAFAHGDRLPSESELSRLLGVSVVTVREALVTLRAAGVIETRRGRQGGSFVALTTEDAEELNAKQLMQMPRVELADLGLHYEMLSAACAELACQRATDFELRRIIDLLDEARDLPRESWRRSVTDAQLELASLSHSVNLTREHVRVQSQFTPLLALQDADTEARRLTHESLKEQVGAILAEDIEQARRIVREGIRRSTQWLIAFRQVLLADPSPEHIRLSLQRRESEGR